MLEKKQAWQLRWQQAKTGWDLHGAHPLIEELVYLAEREGNLASQSSIWVPGCGHGHDAYFLYQKGYRVSACDFVEEAISAATHLYSASLENLDWRVCDALDKQSNRYQAVYDRAMLCALQPENRKTYIQRVYENLDDEGIFFGILFAEVQVENGPPFSLDEVNLWELFEEQFELVHLEPRDLVTDISAISKEWLCIWRRKSI